MTDTSTGETGCQGFGAADYERTIARLRLNMIFGGGWATTYPNILESVIGLSHFSMMNLQVVSSSVRLASSFVIER